MNEIDIYDYVVKELTISAYTECDSYAKTEMLLHIYDTVKNNDNAVYHIRDYLDNDTHYVKHFLHRLYEINPSIVTYTISKIEGNTNV